MPRTSIYGYSVHVGVDEDGFIHRTTVTAGGITKMATLVEFAGI